MKRAFNRSGRLTKHSREVLRQEGRRIRRFFARNSDICPRDLTLLLMSEVQLAGALAGLSRQSAGKGESHGS